MKRRGGGRHGLKRPDGDGLEAVQAANRAWREQSPMTYDWRQSAGLEPVLPVQVSRPYGASAVGWLRVSSPAAL
jgi:hypothetical protein